MNSLRMKTTIGFALACLIICGGVVSSNLSTSAFIDDAHWMLHTVEVQDQIDELTREFLTAQNNVRGYHMAEQDYYFDLHTRARAKVNTAFVKLRELLADNPMQQKNLDAVESNIDEKFKSWDQSFELHKKEGFKGIAARMRAESGKNQDESIFDALRVLKNTEAKLYQKRITAANAQAEQAKLILGISGLLAIVLITFAALLVFRDNRRREMAEAEIDRFFTLSLDMLCISGQDGYFKRLSPSYTDVLGFSLNELYTKPILEFVHPEDVEPTLKEIERQRRGERVISFENRYRCKDGSYKILSWKSVPVGDMMYAVARDVTQQKDYESELNSAREAAQRALSVKSLFLANMSHELRTPLNGVVGMSDLLARSSLADEQRGFVTAIRGSATILLNIINEILDFSKIEAGRAQLETSDFDLRQLIESRISLVGVMAAEKDLRIEIAIDPRIPNVVRGDSVKLGQVVLNLLSNAVKFTDSGTIQLQSEVLNFSEKEFRIKVSIRDSGIGMSQEQQERLFQPFMQVEEAADRRFGGTGLGLSICKRLIELMGGEIGVESRVGRGSTFWFQVDLQISNQPAIPVNKPANSRAKPSEEDLERRKSIRILIAEDNRINQVVTLGMLAALGYSTTLAENGQQALDLYSSNKYDLILMDHQMPVMDGFQASDRIRALEQGTGKRVPIIGFSATVMQDEQMEQFRNLMDGFILKPVTMEVLETVLTEWEGRLT